MNKIHIGVDQGHAVQKIRYQFNDTIPTDT